jgi:hypothetical protein
MTLNKVFRGTIKPIALMMEKFPRKGNVTAQHPFFGRVYYRFIDSCRILEQVG